MTVYVESNFVLEIALGQEQASAAEAVLERSERGEITLAIPSFSLSEPFSTVSHRSRSFRKLGKDLGNNLRELGRSHPHQEGVRALESAPAFFAGIEKRELERLTLTVGRLLSMAIVIATDAAVFAEAMTIVDQIGLDPQDALIYASVLAHLRTSELPSPHYFINRNSRDFADPRITAELRDLNCEFLRSFVEGALRLEQPLPD